MPDSFPVTLRRYGSDFSRAGEHRQLLWTGVDRLRQAYRIRTKQFNLRNLTSLITPPGDWQTGHPQRFAPAYGSPEKFLPENFRRTGQAWEGENSGDDQFALFDLIRSIVPNGELGGDTIVACLYSLENAHRKINHNNNNSDSPSANEEKGSVLLLVGLTEFVPSVIVCFLLVVDERLQPWRG
ncbi:hypothetical protein M422DRAFT_269244 [Sphaerobolus stellatus SS14]|uniref:Uncharacterized protein n=1 Tax=Sphaerobolus stellatus (strain SS14) TaxID=990650 RepID=A0A0C9U5A7_SPHS4|nr:hypothetical protein M422DRAFT_269244 [Sphaerobolus stellatus SS14]